MVVKSLITLAPGGKTRSLLYGGTSERCFIHVGCAVPANIRLG
jgi:hypothetical protein